MKKILIFAVVLSLLVPAAALADTEFSLGGYIKLDSYWDSTQNGKNMNGPVARDNDTSFHHGNMRFTAQGTRFNFTIKGPEVLGAKLTGFIEMDFDSCTDTGALANPANGNSSSNNYIPRLRHAMFRLNWPCDTELLFGQYWSMFCDWFPEVAEDGPFQVTGIPTARLPQIRLTQGFAGDWKVAGLIGLANSYSTSVNNNNPYGTSTTSGTSAETPQVQGQIKYAHDWWGKAAFYGVPTPFTASITAAWQRNVQKQQDVAGLFNENRFGAFTGWMGTSYVSPWMIQGSFFIPVIPTYNNNLAGTAHLLIQPWIGQGVTEFGITGDGTGVFKLNDWIGPANWQVTEKLLHRFGAMLEGQYYFTNQWFLNAAYGVSAAFDVNSGHIPGWDIPVQQYAYNSPFNQSRMNQQVDATLWYQPIKALKFGLQYSFFQTKWLLDAGPSANNVAPGTAGKLSDLGHEHRVEFVGYFFF